MATTGIDHDTTSKAIAKVDNSLLGLLKSPDVQKQLALVATKHLTPEKLMRLVTTEVKKTPALARCSIESVMQCVMEASRLGLQPGGALGQFYIVPYGTTATPIVGYRGFITLARRSGKIRRLEAHVVYESDEFQVRFGTDPGLTHIPSMKAERGDIVAAYMVVQMEGESIQVEVMTREDILAIRDRSRASKNGPWVTDFAEMCRKTVVRRGCKYLPMDTEEAEPLARAMELDADDFEPMVSSQPERKAPQSLRSALQLEHGDPCPLHRDGRPCPRCDAMSIDPPEPATPEHDNDRMDDSGGESA